MQGPLRVVLSLCSLIPLSTSLPLAHSALAMLASLLPLARTRQSPHLKAFALAVPFLQSALLLDIPLTKTLTSFKFQLSVTFLLKPTLFGLFNNTACFPPLLSHVLNSNRLYLAILFLFFVALSTLSHGIYFIYYLLFVFSLPARLGVGKLWPVSQILAATCFCK